PPNFSLNKEKPPLGDFLLRFLWSSRHPRERYTLAPMAVPDRIMYHTKDGWEIQLERFPNTKGRGEPLIISTGPVIHPRILTLDKAVALQSLRAQGFDVYLFSHRGHSLSKPLSEVNQLRFDHIIQQDIPAAIDAVKRVSKSKRVFWLGHGLGGLMLYAWLSYGGGRDIAGAITIDSPAFFAPGSRRKLLKLLSHLLPENRSLPTSPIALLGSQMNPTLSSALSPRLNRSILRYGCEDISTDLFKQMMQWLESGRFFSYHQGHNYLTGLKGSQTPIMFMSGLSDEINAYLRPMRGYFQNSSLHVGKWDVFPLLEEQAASLTEKMHLWAKPYRDKCWTE
ncbi:MAG: alpha/beta fold hydrolase, partial [Myxococcota bacterium]|nr:alpha/beta fold hydrolase [Myxococcota bacterium]